MSIASEGCVYTDEPLTERALECFSQSWFDESCGSCCELQPQLRLNRYVIWSKTQSCAHKETGQRWDCANVLNAVRDAIPGAANIVRIAVCPKTCCSESRLRLEKHKARRKGIYWVESQNSDGAVGIVHGLEYDASDATIYAGDMPMPGWLHEYAMIGDCRLTPAHVGLEASFRSLLDQPSVGRWPIDTITKEFFLWGTMTHIAVVLFYADEQFVRFPALYSRDPIGSSVVQGLAAIWRKVSICSYGNAD